MPRFLRTIAVVSALGCAGFLAQGADAGQPTAPLQIKKQGDFFVNGQVYNTPATASDSTGPAPGEVIINQVFVQYQIPVHKQHKFPIVLDHGSWHTGKTYLTTPDGREGWATYMLRKGFSTYVMDDLNRGRSGYDMTQYNLVRLGQADPTTLEPMSQTENHAAWTSFRIGPTYGEQYPGGQFPVESFDQYCAQLTDMYRGTDQAALRDQGLESVFDKVGPAILLTHSSTGPVGWDAAVARPNLVKAVISVEPIGYPTAEQLSVLVPIPILIIRGDHDTQDGIQQAQTFVDSLNAAGGDAKFISLPDVGIHGNGHMMMLERNNLQIANLIIKWIHNHVDNAKHHSS